MPGTPRLCLCACVRVWPRQAVYQPYERYQRGDGHTVLLPDAIVNSFEGGALFTAPGTYYSKPTLYAWAGGGGGGGGSEAAGGRARARTLALALDSVVPSSAFANVTAANDTDYIKHVRLRSPSLSTFWGQCSSHRGTTQQTPNGCPFLMPSWIRRAGYAPISDGPSARVCVRRIERDRPDRHAHVVAVPHVTVVGPAIVFSVLAT